MKALIVSAFVMIALVCPAQTDQPGTQNQNPHGPQPGGPRVGIAPGPAANFPRGVVQGVPGQMQGSIPGQAVPPNGVANPFQTGNFGLNEVQALLEGLQTDVEQAVPVIARLISGNQGVDRVTGLPNQLVNTAIANQNPQAYQGFAGTNALTIDPQTFHQLVVLQNNLQQTLLSLREINGGNGVTTLQNAGQLSPTGFTNRFNRIPQNPAQQQQQLQQQIPRGLPQPNAPNGQVRQLHNPAIQNPTPAATPGAGR